MEAVFVSIAKSVLLCAARQLTFLRCRLSRSLDVDLLARIEAIQEDLIELIIIVTSHFLSEPPK